MSHFRLSSRWARTATLSLAIGLASGSSVAWAGELRFGTESLEVDEEGKLTSAGRAAATNKARSVSADEEIWQVAVWAKVDKALPGPVYFEFYRNHQGKRLSAYNHEYAGYGGEKYLSTTIELVREMGFHFGDVLEVELVQIGDNDKARVLGKAKLTLEKGAATSSSSAGGGGAEAGAEGEEGEEGEPEADAQDIADGLAGGDEDPGVAPGGPPPADPKAKKGCHVDAGESSPWALAILLSLAVSRRRRPRSG